MSQTPDCLSAYERGNTTCDGNPLATVLGERAPCSWRNRCEAFKVHCTLGQVNPQKLLRNLAQSDLIKLCDRRVLDFAVFNGIATHIPVPNTDEESEPEKPTKVTPADRRIRSVIKAGQAAGGKGLPCVESMALMTFFTRALIKSLGPSYHYSIGTNRLIAFPGSIYRIDRPYLMYSSFYALDPTFSSQNTDTALSRVYMFGRMPKVDIHLPVSAETARGFATNREWDILAPRDKLSGKFTAHCPNQAELGCTMACKVIARLVRADLIAIAEASEELF